MLRSGDSEVKENHAGDTAVLHIPGEKGMLMMYRYGISPDAHQLDYELIRI